MSWAGTVWRLEGQSGVVYVKRAGDLRSWACSTPSVTIGC